MPVHRLYNNAMPRFVHILWITLATIVLVTCARDVNLDSDEEPYPEEVRIAFRTRGTFSSDYWYYMVFNYSAAPSEDTTTAPVDEVGGENRGANWEMYIAYHRDTVNGDQLVTLQRPRIPTILPTAGRPVDIVPALITDDAVNDLLVACADDDVVQLIEGIAPDYLDPIYFEHAVNFDAGPQPIALDYSDHTGDGTSDISIVYAGRGDNPAVIRVLGFESAGVYPLLSNTPVTDTPFYAARGNFDFQFGEDWALLTRNATTQAVTLRIYLGDGEGAYTESAAFPVEASAVQVVTTQLNSGGLELLVAQSGPAGGSGSIAVFTSTEEGVFSADDVINVDGGTVTSVAAAEFLAAKTSLLVGYNTSEGVGKVALYLNDGSQNFTLNSSLTMPTPANYVAAFDASNDSASESGRIPDAVVLNGDPDASTGSSLYIVRGKREVDTETLEVSFAWDEYLIDYLTGNAPSKIITADLNGDGKQDLLIPNSGSGTNGDSICILYGLGHTNYTSADVYWTDTLPELFGGQDWVRSYSVAANTFDITIDPAVFYDLARLPPEQVDGFNVTFMTATHGIYYDSNPDRLGEVLDVLTHPVNVEMTVGHYNDEQNTPLANANSPSADAADIYDWRVEVN